MLRRSQHRTGGRARRRLGDGPRRLRDVDLDRHPDVQSAGAGRQAFERFGSEPTVKRLQLARAFDVYWSKAKEIFARYDLADAQDAALAYDIAVQNGGVKPSTDEAIRRRIAGVTDRQEKRMIIAEEV